MKLVCNIAILLFMLFILFPPVRIIGTSMYPTYKPGQIIVGSRIFSRRKPKIGHVYIFRRYSDNIGQFIYVIKRLERLEYDVDCRNQPVTLCYFLGDNPSESIDSRYYGFVSEDDLIAKVLFPRKIKQKLTKEVK